MPGSPFTIPASTLATRTWAILPGVREWVLLALLVVALFGRSGSSPSGRSVGRWLRPLIFGRREPAWVAWAVDRWRLVLALFAGAGLLAWVATSFRVARAAP